LKVAFAAFVADRAVEWMIYQDEFEHRVSRFFNAFGICMNDHALLNFDSACGLKFRNFFDFDKAHAASAIWFKRRVMAESRNINSHALSGDNQSGSLYGFTDSPIDHE
jgi:hypothetical protein